MSQKSKGTNAERDLVHKFWAEGFAAIRSAGSGSMKYPSPDLLVAKEGNIIAIECKTTKNQYKYIEKKEIDDLREFSRIFNAIPRIAIKFKGEEWIFIKLEDLGEKGKSFMVDIGLAKRVGRTFEDFV